MERCTTHCAVGLAAGKIIYTPPRSGDLKMRGGAGLLCKALPGYLNALAIFMRKEPTRIGSGSTFNAGCRGYTAVFRAR